MGGNTMCGGSFASGVSAPSSQIDSNLYPPNANFMIDKPPSGSWLLPFNSTAGTLPLNSNQVQGCYLFVPTPLVISNMGINIQTAGDSSSIVFLSLYQKVVMQNLYRQVLGEQQINVGVATGIQQVAINLPVSAGRFIALVRNTSGGTNAVITSRNGAVGFWSFAMDSVEATTDMQRGGIHPSQIAGYVNGAPPAQFSLTTVAASRQASPSVFLQVA